MGTAVATHHELWEIKGEKSWLHMHPGQLKAWDSKKRWILVLAGSQSGKALACDTPIPVLGGFKKMGDLRIGDTVFNEQGQPTTVTYVSPVYLGNKCYELTFDEGSKVVADGGHLWVTRNDKQRKNMARRVSNPNPRVAHQPQCQPTPDFSVLTTEQIKDTLLRKRGSKFTNNHAIDMAKPFEGLGMELPVPPYVLGVWLGDGNTDAAHITTADMGVLDEIRSEGVTVGVAKNTNSGKAFGYRLGGRPQESMMQERNEKGQFNTSKDTLQAKLRALEVLGNKHIPLLYLTASKAQRLALLQGLMDTDGCISKSGKGMTCEYCTVLPRLADDVVTLCRGLGIKASVHTKIPKCNGKECRTAYRVVFTTAVRVFRLQRKAEKLRDATRPDTLRRSIVSCVPVPTVPVRCITVDSASSQYLCTKSYIPTHNTSWGPLWLNREIIEKGPGDYLGVTATFPLLKLKMLPELQKCFETYLRIATYVASDHIFKSNEKVHGAEAWRIILGSASNAESLESATAKAAWCDEAGQKSFSLSAWEAVRRRLALNRGRALMTTTPYGLGWLKSEFYDKAMAGDPDIELIQFDSTLNPAFPKEEFEQRRAEMPLWKFNMFYRGMFERPVGLIYDAFDESICKIKRFPIPESWPCYVGHDFGGANPAALFFRVDPTTGYIYAWQEYRPREGRSIHQHVEQFKKITANVMVFKRAGGSHQEDEIRQGYTAHGWPISEPKFHGSASVEAGIAAVYALHKRNKLFIFDDLVNYLDEKSTYSRKLDANFIPTDEIDNKSDYHLLDSERSILSDFSPDTATGNRAKTKRSSFAF